MQEQHRQEAFIIGDLHAVPWKLCEICSRSSDEKATNWLLRLSGLWVSLLLILQLLALLLFLERCFFNVNGVDVEVTQSLLAES